MDLKRSSVILLSSDLHYGTNTFIEEAQTMYANWLFVFCFVPHLKPLYTICKQILFVSSFDFIQFGVLDGDRLRISG